MARAECEVVGVDELPQVSREATRGSPRRFKPSRQVIGHDAVGCGGFRGSLNELIRPLQEQGRERETERLRGLHVDHQLELRRLLDG